MPYTINASILDFGSFYSAAPPPMTGLIFPLIPPFAPGTAVSTPAAPFSLFFPSPSMPPSGPSTVLVRDTGSSGDLFRSGLVAALPPSLGTLTVFTVPPFTVPFASITGAGATSIAVAIPAAAMAVVGILSVGTFIPLSMTLTGTSVPIASATRPLTFTMTGTLTARVFFFAISTYTVTLTFTAVPAPSADASDRSRILKVTATAPSLIASLVPRFITGVLAPVVASVAASRLEALINSRIAALATPALTSLGLRLSPTAVICARRVVVGRTAASGARLNLLLSDLLGPAVLPLPLVPRNFAVAIMPPPQAGSQQAYTVTVTDIATGAPVPDANVTLHNFGANGNAVIDGPLTTNSSGQVTFNVKLRPRIVIKIITGNPEGPLHERERVFISPTLTVAKGGFNTLTMTLLEDNLLS